MGSHCSLLALLLICVAASNSAAPLGPNVTLRGGTVMPSIGLGSSGHCHPDPDGTEAASCSNYNATLSAIKAGYRSFHDALSYSNQAGVGAAIKASGVPRAELFMMSMIPKYLMGYNNTYASVEASLAQLQVRYLDLVMIHHRAADITDWPRAVAQMKAFPDNWAAPGSPISSGGKSLWQAPSCATTDPTWLSCQDQTWKALTELKAAGKVKEIGVSNWMLSNLVRMKQLGQQLPAVNQIEQHIGWHDDEMLDWCQLNGIVVQAASPLSRSLPALVKPDANPVVTAISQKHGKTPAQVALRWLIEKGVSPIPSASTVKYQKENLEIFDFSLSAAEVTALARLALPCRGAAADGLQKCWADPSVMMCADNDGRTFHCP